MAKKFLDRTLCTFDAQGKSIRINGVSISRDRLLLIANTTRNKTYYNLLDSGTALAGFLSTTGWARIQSQNGYNTNIGNDGPGLEQPTNYGPWPFQRRQYRALRRGPFGTVPGNGTTADFSIATPYSGPTDLIGSNTDWNSFHRSPVRITGAFNNWGEGFDMGHDSATTRTWALPLSYIFKDIHDPDGFWEFKFQFYNYSSQAWELEGGPNRVMHVIQDYDTLIWPWWEQWIENSGQTSLVGFENYNDRLNALSRYKHWPLASQFLESFPGTNVPGMGYVVAPYYKVTGDARDGVFSSALRSELGGFPVLGLNMLNAAAGTWTGSFIGHEQRVWIRSALDWGGEVPMTRNGQGAYTLSNPFGFTGATEFKFRVGSVGFPGNVAWEFGANRLALKENAVEITLNSGVDTSGHFDSDALTIIYDDNALESVVVTNGTVGPLSVNVANQPNVQLVSAAQVSNAGWFGTVMGDPTDSPAGTDSGNMSMVAALKRVLQQLTIAIDREETPTGYYVEARGFTIDDINGIYEIISYSALQPNYSSGLAYARYVLTTGPTIDFARGQAGTFMRPRLTFCETSLRWYFVRSTATTNLNTTYYYCRSTSNVDFPWQASWESGPGHPPFTGNIPIPAAAVVKARALPKRWVAP